MGQSKIRLIEAALIGIAFVLNALSLVLKNVTFNEANKLRLNNLLTSLEGIHDMLTEVKLKK
jgi:hypothetical protein